jgi:hypothetical protein
VHHVDGDHSNDEPKNLALIEGLDHMLLFHGVRNYSANKIAGRSGALARIRNSTPKQRSMWARRAVRKRWANVRRAKKEAAKAIASANRAKRAGQAHKAANEARAT